MEYWYQLPRSQYPVKELITGSIKNSAQLHTQYFFKISFNTIASRRPKPLMGVLRFIFLAKISYDLPPFHVLDIITLKYYTCIWYDIWYDMIWCDVMWCDVMIYLTAVELTPGGSSTVHIYTQTIHRTAQSTQTIPRATHSTQTIYRTTKLIHKTTQYSAHRKLNKVPLPNSSFPSVKFKCCPKLFVLQYLRVI